MEMIKQFLKTIVTEVFIISVYVFLINNFFGNVDVTMKADAEGYYDYLPSLFIHHDLIRKDVPIRQDSTLYRRIISLDRLYVNYNGMKVNKCPCGTAVLELPFFTWTYFTTTRDGKMNDGYQRPFQITIFHAAIFYLFLSIFFLGKTLQLYKVKRYVIILCQLLLVLATSVTHYANYDAGYSHVFSLFAITAFIYFTTSYFKNRNANHFIFASLFFGLVLILRQIDIIIILFVPFLAGSLKKLKDGILHLLAKPGKLMLGIFSIFAVFFIQSFLWYLQAGRFLIYSYQGESFNFLQPHFLDILFSYRKGLFVYTPILFICTMSLIWLVYKRNYYLVITWLSFFIVLTYVFSSWWAWFCGCSYGMRVYIDFYAVFFILLAFMLDGIKVVMKSVIILLALLTIPVNIVQTYQYKEFILHWVNMDKTMYWKIFLRTDDKFKGLIWKGIYDYSKFCTVKEISIGDVTASRMTVHTFFKISSHKISDFEKVDVIQVLVDNNFNTANDSKIILGIHGAVDNHNFFWKDPYLIHFCDGKFNEWQTGLYNYDFTALTDQQEKVISLELKSGKQDNTLKNVKLRFLKSI
jgi:hypothetical protein